MQTVRAKMRVNSIERYASSLYNSERGKSYPAELQTVKLAVVTGGSKEDNTFSSSTPAGKLELTITNQDTVAFFELNKTYYIDIRSAEE